MTTVKRHPTTKEFIALLDRCKAQVEADRSGYTQNRHLYRVLRGIFLRLCHGSIPGGSELR